MSEIKILEVSLTKDQISKLGNSEFKQYCLYLLDNNLPVEMPEEYNKSFLAEYMEGFKNYLDLSLRNFSGTFTESQIFFIAVVAYKYRTPHPLIYYDKHITNTLSDTYYWLYLAHTKHFYSVMEIEMFRRRITISLDLVDLSTVEMKFFNETQDNIIKSCLVPGRVTEDYRFIYPLLNIGRRVYVEKLNVNTNLNMPLETILHYYEGLDTLVDKILHAGGIIAGGFVNNLINPIYRAHESNINNLTCFQRNYPIRNDYKTTKFLAKVQQDYPGKLEGDIENKELADHYSDLIYGTEEDIYLSRQNFCRDNMGQLFNLELIKSNDIDVFVTGEDYLEKVRKIVDSLYFVKKFYISKIHYTESSISFVFGTVIKIQIIKRAYTNLEEILGGFDLNPSRVALTLNEGGKWKFVAPQAYIDAVQYGVNVVVPCWQSETFNSRLSKYRKKGFDIYLPGKIINRFNVLDKIDLNSKGNLVELITHIGNPHKWNMRDLSDYESSSLEYLARVRGIVSDFVGIDKRAPEVILDKRDPNMNDLVYLINSLFREYNRHEIRSYQVYELLINILPTFWRTTNPSTQLTGSFNPTRLNYLSGEAKEEIKSSGDFLDTLKDNLLDDIIAFVKEYNNPIKELYQRLVGRKNFPRDLFIKEILPPMENQSLEPERDPNSDLDGPENDPNSDLD